MHDEDLTLSSFRDLCSTPFGDIDGCTARSVFGLRHCQVLNAFRRH